MYHLERFLQDLCHLARILQGSNFFQDSFSKAAPPQGFNAEIFFFLFGVHQIQLDAIPVSIESEPLKNNFLRSKSQLKKVVLSFVSILMLYVHGNKNFSICKRIFYIFHDYLARFLEDMFFFSTRVE